MTFTILDYDHYKSYLNDALSVQRKKGRGGRSRFAEALHCTPAYISRLLKLPDVQLNAEQGIQMARFFAFDEEETRYLLLLIQYERAGTEELQQFYQREIQSVQNNRKLIEERVRAKSDIDNELKHIYYSSWLSAAVHICLMVKEHHDEKSLAQVLGVSLERIRDTLRFLRQAGLVEQDGEEW